MIHLRSATADQAALTPIQYREQAVAVCNPYRDPEGGLLFFKGHTAPADKPLVPSKAGCSPPVKPGSLPHGTVIVLAGQGEGLWLPGLANFPSPTPQLPNSAAHPRTWGVGTARNQNSLGVSRHREVSGADDP